MAFLHALSQQQCNVSLLLLIPFFSFETPPSVEGSLLTKSYELMLTVTFSDVMSQFSHNIGQI